MSRHPNDIHFSSPAAQRAREKHEQRQAQLLGGHTGRVMPDVANATGVKVDLDVRVDELAEAPLSIKEALPRAWVTKLVDDGKEPHWSAAADATVDVSLEREASFVRSRGEAHFLLSHPCVRCLNDVPFDVTTSLDLRLVERKAPALPADIEHEESDDAADDIGASDVEDLSVASFTDGVVRLPNLLREQLFLELPMHPACDSPLARPTAPCAFDAKAILEAEQSRWVESRWSGLAALRDKIAAAPAANTPPQPAPTAKPQPKHAAPQAPTALPKQATPAATMPATKAAATKKAKPATKKAKPATKKAPAPKKKAAKKAAVKKKKQTAQKKKPPAQKPAAKATKKKAAKKR